MSPHHVFEFCNSFRTLGLVMELKDLFLKIISLNSKLAIFKPSLLTSSTKNLNLFCNP